MSTKKKILIVSHAMELGGAERSLLGLLGAMDYQKYEVDLFLLRHEGELLPFIPKEVHLLPVIPEYTVLARPMIHTLKEGHIFLTAARMFGKLKAAGYDRRYGYQDSGVALEYSHKYTCKWMPDIQPDTEYDLAISFLTPHYFVAEKVCAKKKLAWIHTDYQKIGIDRISELKMWNRMDCIASISDAVTDSFTKVFPELKEKIILIENILPVKLIEAQADAFCVKDEMPIDGCINLLSIGRFCEAKNFDNVPDICRSILEQGVKVRWYLIGYGGDEALIRSKIAEAQMEDDVILLGKKENPYPYIKACDVYVQPSRYEGKCVSVREAQMLGKPVIITNYATSSSQLDDGVDGIIVPMDNQSCADGIVKILKDQMLLERLAEGCRKRDYSNAQECEKLDGLIMKL